MKNQSLLESINKPSNKSNLSFRRNLVFCLFIFLTACNSDKKENEIPLFQLINPEQSGVTFTNKLSPTPEFNILKYLYYYNGAGVATGDLNGDELPDIYFNANQGENKLYLNLGNLKFKDISEQANVAGSAEGWKTGVTMADVNGDGKLDMYVSQLGNYEGIFGKNQLFINQGNDKQGMPSFKEEAARYGLDLVGFSTQAAFFDFDLDGDLDMYMLNHSVHSNGTFERRAKLRNTKHKLAGDKLLKNENGKFIDISEQAGILSSALGYGLGISIGDLNNDGYPDIYIGNDFHENDYLYLNNQDGTFREVLSESMMHTAKYSMGNDIGDINNDGWQDIISLDMLPEDYETLKSSDAEDPFDIYKAKLKFGYNYQYSRNNLQLNLGNGKFSEIGLFSGVAASDWSWASLLADFDLDGYKDIFISNGIPRRLNDLDYIKYTSSDIAIAMRLQTGELTSKELALIEKMPVIKIPNHLYRNLGNLGFENMAPKWGLETPSFSSGAAYADLDNDGDLELIVNNTDDKAFIYKNLSTEQKDKKKNYLKIKFQGDSLNRFGIGAKVIAQTRYGTISQELYSSRGFQSSVDLEIVLGFGEIQEIDSLTVIWANHQSQTIKKVKTNQSLRLQQKNAQTKYIFKIEKPKNPLFEDITEQLNIDYLHLENNFVEFNREPLIPHMVSTEGPALAVGDVNGDGREDFFVGGAKHQEGKIFIQTEKGFEWLKNPEIAADSLCEDVKAELVDIDNDKDLDLLVLSGGNEFYGKTEPNHPRLYKNDGKGNFTKDTQAFKEIYLTAGALALSDFDKDGDIDVFIGARVMPWNYGKTPESYLFINDGKGKLKDIANNFEGLKDVGLVKSAAWGDLDKNGYLDLVIVGEWFPISIFMNEKGKLQKIQPKNSGLEFSNGFWNSVQLQDIDKDGDLDLIAGNLGLNSKLKASKEQAVSLLVDDFDKNEQTDQLLFHYHQGEKRLFATKDEIAKQLVSIKKKFTDYRSYAKAKSDQIIEPEKIKNALELSVFEMQSCIFINEGKGKFSKQFLPSEIQFSTLNTILFEDFDGDGQKDILTAGNFYDNNIQMGRYDASYGSLLLNKGKGNYRLIPNRKINLCLQGQVREMKIIRFKSEKLLILGKNKDKLQFVKIIAKKKPV